jgi:hypothetical protein
VVVVLVVLDPGLGVEQVVAREQLKELPSAASRLVRRALTKHAALQISTDWFHRVPKMISGHRYCLVWISFVKW